MASPAALGATVLSPTASIAVSVRHVAMSYSGVAAVDDVSFELSEGAFLTILGPSGSGKTTLLRMIAGFQTPTKGEIVIGGQPVRAVPPYRRSIGMVFQRLALFPHMTAAENVAFPLKMRRFDARTIPERVDRYLDLVKLAGLGERRINELSGGQQQRVAIARALVFEPDLLLLDEPLASLDRKLREEMQLEFRRIQRELGVTTINVTHDQREALIMSDEIIVMDKGRIQQIGRPTADLSRAGQPVRRRLHRRHQFPVGQGARDCRIEDRDRGRRGEVDRQRLPATSLRATTRIADAALRAEQIRIAGSAKAIDQLETVVQGKVEDVIFEGERVAYDVVVADLDGVRLRVLDHDPGQHAEFAIGATVFLGWNARDLLIFAR